MTAKQNFHRSQIYKPSDVYCSTNRVQYWNELLVTYNKWNSKLETNSMQMP